jgi:diaminopimelate epimerase
MKTINFYKLTGAGNDFILFDKRENGGLEITPDFVQKVCSRRFGVGSDGILVIEDSDKQDFNLLYYNADGSSGVLCGNGARCAIRYAKFSGRIKNCKTEFTLNNNLYSGEVLSGDLIRFDLNEPKGLQREILVFGAGQLIQSAFIDTGSPHLVININNVYKNPVDADSFYTDINKFPVKEFGSEIRYSDAFAPDGINVNFISLNEDKVIIRTYERGVEEETLACGTGSAAAAVIAVLNYGVKRPVNLLTAGGNILTVDFSLDGNRIEDLSLTGPAKIVFKGEITI